MTDPMTPTEDPTEDILKEYGDADRELSDQDNVALIGEAYAKLRAQISKLIIGQDEVVDELANGNRLEFREFGVFEVRQRASRQAQNPRTLEKVEVPSRRVVKFKVGRKMRERVGAEITIPVAPVREEQIVSSVTPPETPPPPPLPPPTTSSPF